MTTFRTVRKNGKMRVVPIERRKFSVQRRVNSRDLLKFAPQKIARIVRSSGFENSDYDPFEFKGPSREFSINGMRLSGINQAYLGEEAASFYSSGKEVSSVFYSDIGGFKEGGKARIGGGKK